MPVKCPYCGREFKGDKLNARHLSVCNPELRKPVPPCLCGHEATSLTQMKRHRRICDVWKNRDKKAISKQRRKETMLERHGVENCRHVEGAEEKLRQTNLERYGAENPFAKESSVFDKVQASLEGKRPVLKGQDNPFAWESTKEKIRETMLERHGVENAQQVPEIRAQTRETNMERYGVEETLAAPEIRERIRETCQETYGGPAPSCSPEVQAKTRETNLERYGVPWTCMNPEVRRKQVETMEARYGGHFFASGEGREKIRKSMLERYGVEFFSQLPEWWETVEPKQKRTWLRNYGVDHPMKDPEIRIKALRAAFNGRTPNLFERRILGMAPILHYTGNGTFWKWLPALQHAKNPDFIVPGPVKSNPKKGVTKVIEAFGDYWHSKMFTGKAPFDHEQELISAFAEIGIQCLVIWESEVKEDPGAVAQRLVEFLTRQESDSCPATSAISRSM
jgi:hypothetical protein